MNEELKDAEREAFENCLNAGTFDVDRVSDFHDFEIEAAWRGWQARAALTAEKVADDARDAARYRWLRQNCFDWAAPGEGDSFDHIELHFEHELLGRDDSTVDEAIDAEIAHNHLTAGAKS